MHRTLLLKLHMKSAHTARFSSLLESCVLYHNAFVIEGEEFAEQNAGKYPSAPDQQKLIKDLRPFFDPKKEAHTHVFQDIAKRIALGRKLLKSERKKGNRKIRAPQERSECRSIGLKEHGNGFRIIKDDAGFIQKIKLSGIGSIPVVNPMRLPEGAEICSLVVKENTSGVFASLVIEYPEDAKRPDFPTRKEQPLFPYSTIKHKAVRRQAVGVDLGIASFLATEDGDKFACPQLEARAKELRALDRDKDRKLSAAKAAGRRDESRRLENLKRKIARHHEKSKRIRLDFLHKVASYLRFNYRQIFCEDLGITQMIEKSKSYGRNFRRRIYSAGWGSFLFFLENGKGDALAFRGDPAYTSSICPYCLHPERKPLGMRIHHCAICSAYGDRDVISARVVRIQGQNPERLSVPKAVLRAQSIALRANAESPAPAR